MARLFGTNGIRGVFGEDFTLQFIHDISLSLGAHFKRGPILVGYDGRESSQIVSKIVCSSLNEAGLDCSIAGLVPTPALEFAVKSLGYSGGVMVTASHNPPEYNGIKPVASDGVEISRSDELKIERIYFGKKWNVAKKLGRTSQEGRVIRSYLDGIKSQVDAKRIQKRKLKVVLDLGNGAQAVAAPALCSELGCKVFLINEKVDGKFPGRGSEPTPQNLGKLSKSVIRNGADLGVAFDGDGDRSMICDENGRILTGDRSALLMMGQILERNPRSKVVTCMNSSYATERLAEQTRSKVIRTKVGSVEVSRMMVPERALVGFEENGGFMYGRHNQVRDGAMTLALMLHILAGSNRTVSEMLRSLPESFTTKDKVECSREEASKVIKTLKKENPSSDTRDGIKIVLDSKNWVMVRPSGTEPIARIYAESDSQENLDKLVSGYVKKVKRILSQ